MQHRGAFSSRIGFVLAAAGSAVGLGNLWRFPSLAAKYGGGIFVLIYILMVVTLGYTLMTAELVIGRKTGKNVVDAYKDINKKYTWVGYFSVIIPYFILTYYCVIGGWVVKYFVSYLANTPSISETNFFANYIGKIGEPIFYQSLFVIATGSIVMFGIKKGIEKASKILMPLLILLSVVIATIVLFQPGAIEGLKYYLIPDFSKFSFNAVLAALGQVFFSLSLAMGIMVTYGSYVKKEEDLEKSVKHIEIFDTGVALLAGLMIIPAVFSVFGNDPEKLKAGAGLVFITLPGVFAKIPYIGNLLGVLFFLLVIFAALTSTISLMETVTAFVVERWKLNRILASIIISVSIIIIGVPSSLGHGAWSHISIMGLNILDFVDFLTNQILMPTAAIATCMLVGYSWGVENVAKEMKLSSPFKREKLFNIMIKYIAPIAIFVILVSSILNTFGIINL